MSFYSLLIAFTLFAFLSVTKKVPKCDSPEARAFDFWIGDWDIRQKILRQDGTWLELDAKTSVSPILDGCALIEHWEGNVQFFWEGMHAIEPMEGLSVRSYQPEAGEWSIYWMDSRNPQFGAPYTGNFVAGRGEFFRVWQTPNGKRMGRITFSDIRSDSVHWELATSSDEGQNWLTLWIMDMVRTAVRSTSSSGGHVMENQTPNPNEPTWEEVDSGPISAFRYDQAAKTLEVRFKNTGIYRYFEVPAEVVDGLRKAASKGSYLQSQIIDAYPTQRGRGK